MDKSKAVRVTVHWKGIERPSVFTFKEGASWDLAPDAQLKNKFWNFRSGNGAHFLNLDDARHVEVVYGDEG